MMQDPAEKNLKHKTDVLAWDKIHWEPCDLNFRPPDAEWLEMSISQAYMMLLLASGGTVVAGYLVSAGAASFLSVSATLLEASIVGLVLAALVGFGFYRLLPRAIRHRGPGSVFLALASVPLFYLAVRFGFTLPVFHCGVVTLFCLAIPWSMVVADQFTGHMVHWFSAGSGVEHETMVRWRKEWDERFLSHPINSQSTADLYAMRNSYWQGHAWVIGACVTASVGVFVVASVGHVDEVGVAICGAVLVALTGLAMVRFASLSDALDIFRTALGQWFLYMKNTVAPPWIFQSPAGWQLGRLCMTVVAIVLLTVGVVFMGFATRTHGMKSMAVLTELPPIVGFKAGFHALVAAPVIFLLVCFIISTPVLSAAYRLLERPLAPEKTNAQSPTETFCDRLQASRNPTEKDSIYLGHTVNHKYPVLLPTELLFEHMHILGGTGTCKTALGLTPLAVQLIRKNDGPVILIDNKGDRGLFHTARLEAEKSGRKFKWFTNKPHQSTYIFNPCQQSYLHHLTLQEIVGLFIASLNLHHGDDYGRAYYSMIARSAFENAVRELLGLDRLGKKKSRRKESQGIGSFERLYQEIRRLCRSEEEFRGAQHLACVLESLVGFKQLNMSPGRQRNHPALKHAIHMPEVIREKQVVYFFLTAAMDLTSVAEIARLALYSALCAALAYRDETGEKPRVYTIVDEAQIVIAQNIANVLAQAREHGLACILAHQSLSQLNPPGGVDLRELVMSCTSVKQFWSARDPNTKDYISKISGEVGYYTASWDQFKHRVQGGEIGRQFAASHPNEPMYIQVCEEVGPRLTSQDIEDHSREDNTSIVTIERNAGFSCFQGAFPVHMDWMMSREEYERRSKKIPWPAVSEETIEVESDWPKEQRGDLGMKEEDTERTQAERKNPGADYLLDAIGEELASGGKEQQQ